MRYRTISLGLDDQVAVEETHERHIDEETAEEEDEKDWGGEGEEGDNE